MFGELRRQLEAIFHALAKQKECEIVEGHFGFLLPSHLAWQNRKPPDAENRTSGGVVE